MKTPVLFRQYTWLIDTINRLGKVSLKQLNNLWVREEISEGVEMNRITFNRHLKAIEEIFDIIIECEKSGEYRYYIKNARPLLSNNIQNWYLSTFSMQNLLLESASMNDRILMDVVPGGLDKLPTVLRAMKQNNEIQLCYRSFYNDHDTTFRLQPYCLKHFQQRWYLVAKTESYGLSVFSFDRMLSVEQLDSTFEMDPDFNGEAFFANCFGISVNYDVPVQHVVVRAFGVKVKYFTSLPLHHSQQIINQGETDGGLPYADFDLYLMPTYDFVQELLKHTPEIEVLKPQSLRDELIGIFAETLQYYEEGNE